MHACERVDIAIGHRGGRGLHCTCMELGRVLDTCIAAKTIAPMSRIADWQRAAVPQRRASASPDCQQVGRQRTTPLSAPVCSFRPCPFACSSPGGRRRSYLVRPLSGAWVSCYRSKRHSQVARDSTPLMRLNTL
jgi:hypothetical protein